MFDEVHDAAIIYNPASGRHTDRRRRDLEQSVQILKEAGIRAELIPTAGAGSATELARAAARNGRDLVVVCGGDGTINEVVNGLAGTQVPLAVLPAGTANILAKELGIPWDIPAAARLISRGRLARIALGEILWREQEQNGPPKPMRRYFLCVGGAGPDGTIVHAMDATEKRRVGILAYWRAAFSQFFRYQFPEFRVMSREHEMTATLMVVGRTKYYGGPFRITTGASLFEDSFEVVAYAGHSRWGVLACLPAIWLGCLRRVPEIHAWKTAELRCEAADAATIFSQVDGEAASALPVRFRIAPNALTLVLPESGKE